MKKQTLFCLLALLVITVKSQVRPTISWVNFISDDSTMSSVSTGLDGSSNVYTAGRVYNVTENIRVQCTDSTGSIQWNYTYDNGGYDSPTRIKIDGTGNTFVAGYSHDAMTSSFDYVVIKLDTSGNAVWVCRFDAASADDIASDLAIDTNGDVYVTGQARNGGGNWDAATIKIDGAAGGIIWTDIHNPANGNDVGVCLTVANGGSDVIVGADSDFGSGTTDIEVYQLNTATGVSGWNSQFNGTANNNDKISAIILSGGNVVVAGMLHNTDEDYCIIKLNAINGTSVFQRSYDFSTSDHATSLVRDSADNIAVTGVALNSSLYEYHTIMYDSTGTALWTHKKETGCNSLNVDPIIVCDTIAHHFYISGEIENSSRDINVYQLTPGGNLGWEKSYDGQANGADVATSLVVNGIGVVFVSANTTNSGGNFDLTTMKITQTPVYFPPDYGTLELPDENFLFEENRGQLLHPNGTSVSNVDVEYFNQGTSPSTYFNPSRISWIVSDKDSILDSLVRVDINLMGSNPLAEIFRYELIEPKKHYFTTSALGITDVRSAKRLFIPEVYPNVDVHHYSNTRGLKTYFVFKQPSEMTTPRLQVAGADSSNIRNGNLVAYTGLGIVNIGMLTAYQATYNPMTQTVVLMPVTVSWNSLGSNTYNFNISGYIPSWPVVVYLSKPGATSSAASSPIGNLWWSTFIGGQGSEEINKNRIDAKDNYYICGKTEAVNYPVTSGAFQAAPGSMAGAQLGIMNKFDKLGALIYGTYYGGLTAGSSCGSPWTQIFDIAIDSIYNIYLVGLTNTTNLKTQTISVTGALNYTSNASTGGYCTDAFIAKLNPSGNALRFASYFGGNNDDRFSCVRYKNGQIHIGGWSSSSSIPLVTPQSNAYQISTGNGLYLHLDTAGSMIHDTRIQNFVVGLDADKNGNCYLISNGYSTPTVPIITPAPGFYSDYYNTYHDWVLQRFTPADSLNWSTYIGGNQSDDVTGIDIKDSVLALCGYGTSSTFTFVTNPGDSGDVAPKGLDDIQLMKINLKTGTILWSAYHATLRNETPSGISLDKDFNLVVTGSVYGSGNFRTTGATGYYQQNTEIGLDAFIICYNRMNQRMWTTFFGSGTAGTGSTPYNNDRAFSTVLNNDSKLFIAGITDVKNNTLPLVRWNNVCFYDSIVADVGTSKTDGFSSMFDLTELSIVGVKNNGVAENEKSWLLYPNPNTGIFTVRFTEQVHEIVNINVVNVLGQKVYEESLVKPERGELTVNLGLLTKGVYFVTAGDKISSKTIKVIIQ